MSLATFHVRAWIPALGILSFLACSRLLSQDSSGRIFGNITDQSGGSVVGAQVTVTDIQRGTARTMTTDLAGAYSAPNLTPGSYAVRVEFEGFKVIDRRDIP